MSSKFLLVYFFPENVSALFSFEIDPTQKRPIFLLYRQISMLATLEMIG